MCDLYICLFIYTSSSYAIQNKPQQINPKVHLILTLQEEKDFDSQLKIYREELRKDEHPKKTSSSASVVPRWFVL